MVVYVLLAILLIALIVFGISSGLESYASAQQSQAAIEQARAVQDVAAVAQISAWGNVIVILALLTILVVILGVIIFVSYIWLRINKSSKPRTQTDITSLPGMPSRQSIDLMLQYGILQALVKMNGQQPSQYLEAPKDEVEPDPFPWIR